MTKDIINRVANSGLINLDLNDYFPKEKIIEIDLKNFLFQDQVLKENEFRESQEKKSKMSTGIRSSKEHGRCSCAFLEATFFQ